MSKIATYSLVYRRHQTGMRKNDLPNKQGNQRLTGNQKGEEKIPRKSSNERQESPLPCITNGAAITQEFESKTNRCECHQKQQACTSGKC
jgi:hypothetical protein